MKELSYQNLIKIINELSKEVSEEVPGEDMHENIDVYDPSADMYQLLMMYKTFKEGTQTIFDGHKVLNLREEAVKNIMGLWHTVNDNVNTLMSIVDMNDENKNSIIDVIEHTKNICADTYFRMSLLQNLFLIERDVLTLEYSDSSQVDYNYYITEKIKDKEMSQCFKKLNDYIQTHNERLVRALKEHYQQYRHEDVSIQIVESKEHRCRATMMMIVDEGYIQIHNIVAFLGPKNVSLAYCQNCYGFKEEYVDEVAIRNAIADKGSFDIDLSKIIDESNNQTSEEFINKFTTVLKATRIDFMEKVEARR